jgi:hypothetical protein
MPPSNGKIPGWQWYLGEPESSGQLRTTPEDFQVWELPLVEPQGTGAHLWLEIRKRGANTQWVAGQLAAAAGVPLRDIGFAGMKDRHAVTTQWFSVGLQEAARADWTTWDIPDVALLHAHRHSRKLQRGALRGNRFLIVVRHLRGDVVDLEERLNALAERGAPNYFGPQRFGRDGANVERAVRWLEAGGRIKRSQRSLYLSAARSSTCYCPSECSWATGTAWSMVTWPCWMAADRPSPAACPMPNWSGAAPDSTSIPRARCPVATAGAAMAARPARPLSWKKPCWARMPPWWKRCSGQASTPTGAACVCCPPAWCGNWITVA